MSIIRIRLKGVLSIYILLLLAACFWPFNFFQENHVRWEPGGGLHFGPTGVAFVEGESLPGSRYSNLTILMHFLPENPGESSWILSDGLDFRRANFLVGINGSQLVVDIHNGARRVRAAVDRGKPVWLALSMDSTGVTVYLDGTKRKRIDSALLADSSLEEKYPFVLGCRSDGKFPWVGVVYTIAILDRTCEEEDLKDPERLIAGEQPVAFYDFMRESGSVVPNRGSGNIGPFVVPEKFTPLRRAVLIDLAETWVPMPIWGDIVLNILAFVPIGLMGGMILREKLGSGMTIVLVTLASFALSLGIEMLQSYLPGRWSTFMDVVTNTFGGLLGVLPWFSVIASRVSTRLNRSVEPQM